MSNGNYLQWNSSIVGSKLKSIGCEAYVQAFSVNHITGEVLPHLTENHLKELGVKSVGHRLSIMNLIKSVTNSSHEIYQSNSKLSSVSNPDLLQKVQPFKKIEQKPKATSNSQSNVKIESNLKTQSDDAFDSEESSIADVAQSADHWEKQRKLFQEKKKNSNEQ